jgi:hypothetical protein
MTALFLMFFFSVSSSNKLDDSKALFAKRHFYIDQIANGRVEFTCNTIYHKSRDGYPNRQSNSRSTTYKNGNVFRLATHFSHGRGDWLLEPQGAKGISYNVANKPTAGQIEIMNYPHPSKVFWLGSWMMYTSMDGKRIVSHEDFL